MGLAAVRWNVAGSSVVKACSVVRAVRSVARAARSAAKVACSAARACEAIVTTGPTPITATPIAAIEEITVVPIGATRSAETKVTGAMPTRMDRPGMDRPGMDRQGEMRRDGGPRDRVGERGMRRGPARVVSTEQRTRIRSVIRGGGFDSIRGGDFAVRVGASVPARYRFRPLPPEILSYVPEYEGYDYIVVDDQILILDPDTREVVAIIS